MGDCKSLKSVSGLPPNLMRLEARDCRSLEKVSFDRQNLHSFDLKEGEEDCSMKFSNCFRLSPESIDNIEANAMLKIQSLAEGWIHRKSSHNNFICCFPGNKISENRFEYWSRNSCLNFRISPGGGSRSVRRFLVFAICLVFTGHGILRFYPDYSDIKLICEYQLAPASGGFEKFRTEFNLYQYYKGEHVWIVCGKDMVREDNNYVEASFDFQIEDYTSHRVIEVKECGVKVFYVDAESDSESEAHHLHLYQIKDYMSQNVKVEKCGVKKRPDQAERVITTLLGSILPDGTVDIRNSHAVPHTESAEQVALDIEYHHNMLASHQKVNPKEVIVGWYSTGLGVTGGYGV
ncbi:hypothetical protein GQ457_14G025270 [Hibiscus cannabinus]